LFVTVVFAIHNRKKYTTQ